MDGKEAPGLIEKPRISQQDLIEGESYAALNPQRSLAERAVLSHDRIGDDDRPFVRGAGRTVLVGNEAEPDPRRAGAEFCGFGGAAQASRGQHQHYAGGEGTTADGPADAFPESLRGARSV